MAPDELERALRFLQRSVSHARVGVPTRPLAEAALPLVSNLEKLVTGAVDRVVVDTKVALDELLGVYGRVQVSSLEDQTFVNDVPVTTPAAAPKPLSVALHKHHVGSLTFLSELSTDELKTFASLLQVPPAASTPRAALARALMERGLHVELHGIVRYAGATVVPEANDVASLAMRISQLVDESWERVATGKPIEVLALRRRASELIPHVDEPALWQLDGAGLSAQGWHALRVAQLAVLVAQTLGFSRGLQQDHAVAALTHDVGYALPLPQAGTLHGHGMAGVRGLLLQRGFHEGKWRRLFASLHHHEELQVAGHRVPLAGRLLRVVEDYETMTSPRGGRLLPMDALTRLAGSAGTHCDPVLVQALINRLGQYPPGTVLALDDGRVVRSCSGARSVETFARPMAVVLSPGSTDSVPGALIDLATAGTVLGPLKAR